MDITAVLNCHNEGRALHPSLLSLADAVQVARESGLTVEIIIVADMASEATMAHLDEFAPAGSLVLSVVLGDLGLSRNAAVGRASGSYVGFLDADDLWGPNWLRDAFLFSESLHEEVICHPRANLLFGDSEGLKIHPDQDLEIVAEEVLFAQNCWSALSFAPRSVYERVPYSAIDLANGFGFEDWQWNAETVGLGFKHRAVPDTFHCIRIRDSMASLTVRSDENACVIGPARLFSLPTD